MEFKYILALCFTGTVMCQSRLDCRTDTLNSCIKIADPLLEHPRYVFPAQPEDVDHVCNVLFPQTWSEFVTCIKQYTSECLSSEQKSDFNRAVGDSINSVHKMCTNDAYRQDYLQHAECIKEKSTTEVYCGRHYTTLVDMVKGVTPSSQRELCCSHQAFKDCVMSETRSCGGHDRQMSAQDFARAMLDKSLGFLLKQCEDYTPNSRDCPGYVLPPEKTPRQLDGSRDGYRDDVRDGDIGDDNYYPSGGRVQNGDYDQGPPNRDDWTNLNPIDDQREEVLPFEDSFDLDLKPLDPLTEPSNLIPVNTEPPRQRSEDDDSWSSQRKPWLPPDLSDNIQPFDDLFNAIDSSFADARTSSGSGLRCSFLVPAIVSVMVILLWAY